MERLERVRTLFGSFLSSKRSLLNCVGLGRHIRWFKKKQRISLCRMGLRWSGKHTLWGVRVNSVNQVPGESEMIHLHYYCFHIETDLGLLCGASSSAAIN